MARKFDAAPFVCPQRPSVDILHTKLGVFTIAQCLVDVRACNVPHNKWTSRLARIWARDQTATESAIRIAINKYCA